MIVLPSATARRFRAPSLTVLFLVCTASTAWLDGQTPPESSPEPSAESAEAEPNRPRRPDLAFEADSAEKEFTHAWLAFVDGSWDSAGAGFKSLLASVAKKDRDTLQSLIDACKGGPKLDAVVVLAGKGEWRKALGRLEKVERRYGDTPLAHWLGEQRREIESQLFLVLDDFEPAKPSQNAEKEKDEGEGEDEDGGDDSADPDDDADEDDRGGADDLRRRIRERLGVARDYATDPKFVRHGERSLHYRPKPRRRGSILGNTPRSINLGRFDPEVLSEYRWLCLSILAPERKTPPVVILLDESENELQRMTTSLDPPIELQRVEVKPKWIDLRIDLRSKRVRRLMKDREFFGVRLRMERGEERSIYVDWVRLEKP